eukprot:snap_masked-scaffold_5-processed-gene-19.35-mRNA-1 protein AED:1.00 eAED:1.00 QI:0/0/0/0/1/1/3/0/65
MIISVINSSVNEDSSKGVVFLNLTGHPYWPQFLSKVYAINLWGRKWLVILLDFPTRKGKGSVKFE